MRGDGVVDGPRDAAERAQVDDRVRADRGGGNRFGIGDGPAVQRDPRSGEVGFASRAEVVQHVDIDIGRLVVEPSHEVRTDEPGTAGDDYLHEL